MSLFPHFSRVTSELAFGFGSITIAGVDAGRGVRAKWHTRDTVVFLGADEPGLYIAFRASNWKREKLSGKSCSLVAAGGGRYAIATFKEGQPDGIETNDGMLFPDGFVPTMNVDGVLAFLADPTLPKQMLYLVNGSERILIDAGASLFDPNLGQQGLVWSRLESGRFTTYGWRPSIGKAQRLQASYSPEFDPVCVDTPDGPWILAHDDAPRLLLYAWGRSLGIVIEQGITLNPDAVWTNNGWQVAWTNALNQIVTRYVPYNTLRRDLGVELPRPTPTVAAFKKPLWVGGLIGAVGDPGNCFHIKIAENVGALVDKGTGQQVYTYVEGGDLETIRRRILEAKLLRALPVIAGADARLIDFFPTRIDGAAAVAWEVYPRTVTEPPADIDARLSQAFAARRPGDLPVALVACLYGLNGEYRLPIQPLLTLAENITRRERDVWAYFYFSGSGRGFGIGDRPEFAPYLEAVTRASSGIPVTPPPATPPTPKPPTIPKEPDMVLFRDDQWVNIQGRVHDSFIHDLKRPDGLFTVPDTEEYRQHPEWAIAVPGTDKRMDIRGLSVWTGRALKYYQDYQGQLGDPYERAAQQMREDIKNTDEGRRASGETENPR